jgi:hypothetical protein
MTNLLHRNVKFVPKFHQSQCTLQCTFEERVLFIWLDLHVSLCKQQHPKPRQLFLCIHLYFCKLHLSPNPTNKNLTVLALEILVASNSSSLVTIQKQTNVHKNILLTVTNTITSQNIDFSSWITLQTSQYKCNFVKHSAMQWGLNVTTTSCFHFHSRRRW